MATDIEKLRILIQDPADGSELLSDDDLTAILEIESSIYRAAALCCKSLAAKYAQKVSITAGPTKIENQQKFEHYRDLASEYDKRAAEGGGGSGSGSCRPVVTGVSRAEMKLQAENDDRPDNAFTIGMFDIIEDDSEDYHDEIEDE